VRFTYPVIGSCNRLGFPRYLNTPSDVKGRVTLPPVSFYRGLVRQWVTVRTASAVRAACSGIRVLILPCVHSLPIPNTRVVHSVRHRNIPGHTRVFHRPVPDICTGNPQASPPSHPPFFHKFSTSCRPTRPQANSRPPGGAAGGIRMMHLPPEGHEMPDDSAEAGVMAPAGVRRRGI
jgi:hypothetical protein